MIVLLYSVGVQSVKVVQSCSQDDTSYTSSTLVVECIVQPQNTPKEWTAENSVYEIWLLSELKCKWHIVSAQFVSMICFQCKQTYM